MKFFVHTRIFRNTLLVAVPLCVLVLCLVLAGWYPIAIVEGSFILKSQYRTAYNLSYTYYAYLTQNNRTADEDAAMRTQLKSAVFDGLVDAVLVRHELERRMGAEALRQAVNEKIGPLWNDAASREALLEMTGASEKDVKRFFLEQEARNELLSQELTSEGKEFSDWLLDARGEANIQLFFVPR